MNKWEYEVWCLDPSLGASAVRDELERRGHDGWELVATPVWDFDLDSRGRQLVGVLKRQVGIQEIEEPRSGSEVSGALGGRERPFAAVSSEIVADVRSGRSVQVIEPADEPDSTHVVDRSPVDVVNKMIWKVEADLVAIKRRRLVADDESKKARTTHLEVELHLLRQSRGWVKSDADVAWVQSGLEAWRTAYGRRQQRRPEWFARVRNGRWPWARPSRSGADAMPSRVDDFVDAGELRKLLDQTKGRKISFLLAQECAASLIARDPSRTDRDVENMLKRAVGRKVIRHTEVGVLRERMERSGVIPALDGRREQRRSLQPAHE